MLLSLRKVNKVHYSQSHDIPCSHVCVCSVEKLSAFDGSNCKLYLRSTSHCPVALGRLSLGLGLGCLMTPGLC